jgi:hypothetical protein
MAAGTCQSCLCVICIVLQVFAQWLWPVMGWVLLYPSLLLLPKCLHRVAAAHLDCSNHVRLCVVCCRCLRQWLWPVRGRALLARVFAAAEQRWALSSYHHAAASTVQGENSLGY